LRVSTVNGGSCHSTSFSKGLRVGCQLSKSMG
jgi:hypothetical protein